MKIESKTIAYAESLRPIDLHQIKVGDSVQIPGCIFKLKELKEFSFVQVAVRNAIVQCILTNEVKKDQKIKEGDWIRFHGTAKASEIKDPFIYLKNIEFDITAIDMLASPMERMPFDITKKLLNINNDVRFDQRILSMRHPKERAIFKIQEALVFGLREFLMANGFTEIRTPKIVKEGAEGGANIFSLNYFNQTAYLTQSPQFYKEFCTGIFDRVFEIAPVFRAEKHNTNRHINEYTSIDFEVGFINSFYDIMAIETGALASAFASVGQRCVYECALLGITPPQVGAIPSIKFKDAKDLLFSDYNMDFRAEDDLSPSEEQTLCDHAQKHWGSEFVFVTHYPTTKRPFYAKDDPEDPNYTLSFDLLFRGLEITTGGQRIHEYEELVTKIKSRGMDAENFAFFTFAHKHGLPPHGGLGLGLERLTQKIIGLANIKEATMFPRDIHRLTP